MITLTLLALLYFLTTMIASQRVHDVFGVLFLNFLFGWTVIGWSVLLLWALLPRPTWRYIAVPASYLGHRQSYY